LFDQQVLLIRVETDLANTVEAVLVVDFWAYIANGLA
jgi:hypothetical protein